MFVCQSPLVLLPQRLTTSFVSAAERETREIALMVCQAVAYLHSRGITHRDLKPENLLLTKSRAPKCKVTDFGLAKMVTDQTMLKTMCGTFAKPCLFHPWSSSLTIFRIAGTPTYLAPCVHPSLIFLSHRIELMRLSHREVILNTNPAAGYSPAVDAWSIGVVLYSLLTCQTPFDESESTPLPQRMRERRVDFDYLESEGYSENCIDFLRKMLVTDPMVRMSCGEYLAQLWTVEWMVVDAFSVAADAINHPWLQVLPTRPDDIPMHGTMSAADLLLHSLNGTRSKSIESSPGVSASVDGLGSAISLDQSPRNDKDPSQDSLINSQAIGA